MLKQYLLQIMLNVLLLPALVRYILCHAGREILVLQSCLKTKLRVRYKLKHKRNTTKQKGI